MSKTNYISYATALNQALDACMERDEKVYAIGIGVPDPIGVFGTTKGLVEKYGAGRVIDIPISESAVTGIILGSSLTGMRPVMVHMRFEFAMLAIDQMVNQAAKMYYTSNGATTAPITIRMIVGRGWGQSSQHAQCLHAWFAHVPGLKVIMPATAYDAKGMLIAAINDNNPVICIEHRWLYDISGDVPEGYYEVPLGIPKIMREGSDVTIVASSYMTVDAFKAANQLQQEGISAEVIDLRTIAPLDYSLIYESVSKTGRLIVCDQGTFTGNFATEVITRVAENVFDKLKTAPVRITLPDTPVPTTRALANYYYPGPAHIAAAAKQQLGLPFTDPNASIQPADKLDVFDNSFRGPF